MPCDPSFYGIFWFFFKYGGGRFRNCFHAQTRRIRGLRQEGHGVTSHQNQELLRGNEGCEEKNRIGEDKETNILDGWRGSGRERHCLCVRQGTTPKSGKAILEAILRAGAS